jgi:mycothiol synthase
MGTARPARLPRDGKKLERLFEAARRSDGHPPVGEHLPRSGQVTASGQLLTSLVEAGDHVIAYTRLTQAEEAGWWTLEAVLDPAWRDRVPVESLLEEAIAGVAARGGKGLRLWTHLPGLVDSARREGFRLERELHNMEMGLADIEPPAYPPGIAVDRFRPGVDEDELIEVNNLAFAGRPEADWDRPRLAERMSQPWSDPDDILTARQRGRLIGFCWVKRTSAAEGEIYVVAVAPLMQGKGIGRALVSAGLGLMAAKGATSAFLYVEAQNSRARGLYDSLGFRLDHIDRALVREL